MQKINLRELYPDVYKTDTFLDVTDEVQAVLLADKRAEALYLRQMYNYKAQYSLDCDNGIEKAILQRPPTPGRNPGEPTAPRSALCCGDGATGQAGQVDLRPVLPGYDRQGNCTSRKY